MTRRRLTVPDEYLAVYEWRDGTETATGALLDDLWIVPGFYLLSLTDALANYDSFRTSERWDPGWIPLLADGGGDFVVLELPQPGAANGPIRHFRIEDAEHPVEYQSIAAMVATFVAAYEQGVFFVHDDGYLEADDQAFATLAAAMNPNVPWWTS